MYCNFYVIVHDKVILCNRIKYNFVCSWNYVFMYINDIRVYWYLYEFNMILILAALWTGSCTWNWNITDSKKMWNWGDVRNIYCTICYNTVFFFTGYSIVESFVYDCRAVEQIALFGGLFLAIPFKTMILVRGYISFTYTQKERKALAIFYRFQSLQIPTIKSRDFIISGIVFVEILPEW